MKELNNYDAHAILLTDDARVVGGEMDGLVCELRGEVCQVPLALQPRPVRGRDLLLLQQRPVDSLRIEKLGLCM